MTLVFFESKNLISNKNNAITIHLIIISQQKVMC